jgi:hypothetical protein
LGKACNYCEQFGSSATTIVDKVGGRLNQYRIEFGISRIT